MDGEQGFMVTLSVYVTLGTDRALDPTDGDVLRRIARQIRAQIEQADDDDVADLMQDVVAEAFEGGDDD